ncbi:chemosensory receptor A [Elysia marginata]|uniref:Chemosensory receptor A n=1 Tax=Elysia marginata TaxID=1093978 RepID=A0AAV4F1V5_9GAST|nr:chemosensory receptor A [Elysia marginata]
MSLLDNILTTAMDCHTHLNCVSTSASEFTTPGGSSLFSSSYPMKTLESEMAKLPGLSLVEFHEDPGPKPLMSNWQKKIVDIYLIIVFGTILCTFGIVSNIVNLVVYTRQKNKDTVSLSLTYLSVSDLGVLVGSLFSCLCYATFRIDRRTPVDAMSLQYVIGAQVRHMFINISLLTTVFVSVERCLCVVMPLKVKFLVGPRRTHAANILFYVFIFATYIPDFISKRLEWKHDPRTNTTRLMMSLAKNRKVKLVAHRLWCGLRIGCLNCQVVVVVVVVATAEAVVVAAVVVAVVVVVAAVVVAVVVVVVVTMEHIKDSINHIMLPFVGQIIVTGATILMVSALHASSRFRHKTKTELSTMKSTDTSGKTQSSSWRQMNVRDKRVVKMVTVISSIFIICNLPMVVGMSCRRAFPEFKINGFYHNVHLTVFAVVYLASSISASVNTFVYYIGSSKFKQSFHQVFCRGRGGDSSERNRQRKGSDENGDGISGKRARREAKLYCSSGSNSMSVEDTTMTTAVGELGRKCF